MNVFWGSMGFGVRSCLFLLQKYLMNFDQILLLDVHIKQCRGKLILALIGPVSLSA